MAVASEKRNTSKRDNILDTAEDLFKQFGIKRIPVEEICQKAGVSKMTFYKYFKNKNDLVKVLWTKMYDEGMKKIETIINMDIPFPEKVKHILKLKEESVARISHQFVHEYFNAYPELESFFADMYQKSLAFFINFFKNAQNEGHIRKDIRPEFIIAIMENLKSLVNNTNLVKLYPTYQDFVMEVNNYFFYGILPSRDDRE